MSRIVSLWDEITWVSKIWAVYGTGLFLNKHKKSRETVPLSTDICK